MPRSEISTTAIGTNTIPARIARPCPNVWRRREVCFVDGRRGVRLQTSVEYNQKQKWKNENGFPFVHFLKFEIVSDGRNRLTKNGQFVAIDGAIFGFKEYRVGIFSSR